MAAVRRARTMPVADQSDRCDRCGRIIRSTDTAGGFVDVQYKRTLRTDPKCTSALRGIAGYVEIVSAR